MTVITCCCGASIRIDAGGLFTQPMPALDLADRFERDHAACRAAFVETLRPMTPVQAFKAAGHDLTGPTQPVHFLNHLDTPGVLAGTLAAA